MLSKEQIQNYERGLIALRNELLHELESNETPEDFGGDVDDFDEEKNEAESLGNQLAASEPVRERINEIDAALARIKEGAYGACTACGGEVAPRLLDVVPESALCEKCKTRR